MSTSALRVLSLLEHLREGPLTVAELARRGGVDKASVSRSMATLVAAGWVTRGPAGFGLGPRALLLGDGDRARRELARARELVHTVSGLTGLTVGIVSLAGGRQLVLATSEGPEGRPGFFDAGNDGPLWATASGLVLLAQLADEAALALVGTGPLPRLARRGLDHPGVLEEIAAARQRGVVLDRGWSSAAARCVSLPYPWFDGTSTAIFAMAFEGIKDERLTFTESQLRAASAPGATRQSVIDAARTPDPASPLSSTLVDIVRQALRAFHQPALLADSPLAPVDGTVAERADAVRRRLQDALIVAFTADADDVELRAALETGYLDPASTHDLAARRLHIGRTTYFRRLAEAVERLSEQVAAG